MRGAESWEAPRSGVLPPVPAFVSGARQGKEAARTARGAEWLGGVAARVPPLLPCPRRPPTVCKRQIEKRRQRWLVGVGAQKEDEPS